VLADVVQRLLPHYGPGCPVAIVYRASWADQQVVRGRLDGIESAIAGMGLERTASILVGPALCEPYFRESALYDPAYQRRFRGRQEP
jgi:precorrin-4/cobalt-precorrin-4 C11-methyltransferase